MIQGREGIRNKRGYAVAFILLVLFLVTLRSTHITADPPPNLSWSAGYYGDEAGYAHNARNKVLFGKWVMDEYNPYLVNPILTIFDYVSFKLFHPSILSLRLVALFWGILGIFFIFKTLKETTEHLWMAFLGVLLIETNYFFLMYSRIDLSDTMLTNWMLMTLFLWAIGLKKGIFRFFAGLSAIGVLACKPTAAYFSLVVLVAYIFDLVKKDSAGRKGMKETARYLLPYLMGLFLGGLMWLFIYFIPHHAEFAEMSSGWAFLSMPRNWQDFVRRTLGSYAPIVFKHFSWFPFILLMGWFYLPVSLYRLIRNRREFNSLEFFSLAWFVIGYFAVSGLRYRPPRYFISLVPPLIFLSLFGLKELMYFEASALKRNQAFCVPYSGWIVLTFFLWRKYIHIKLLVVFVGIGIFLILTGSAIGYLRRFDGKGYVKKAGLYVVLMIISLSFSQNFTLYYNWWHTPEYREVTISREVGKIVKHGIIAGLWAPMVCMENENRALCIASRWFNDKRPYETYHFTHLFLWRGNRDAELKLLRGPLGVKFLKHRLKLIKGFRIKGSWALLYKVTPERKNDN